MLNNLEAFMYIASRYVSAAIFPKSNHFRKSLRVTTRVSNSLDLDKDQPFVQNVFDVYYKSVKQFGSRSGPIFGRLDLGSNCYQQTTKVVTSYKFGSRGGTGGPDPLENHKLYGFLYGIRKCWTPCGTLKNDGFLWN